MKNLHERDTVDMPLLKPPGAERPRPYSSLVRVELAGLSDVGRVRANNEDHFLVVRFSRAIDSLITNLPAGTVPAQAAEVGYGMVVADGVGGSAGGEVASRLAIQTLFNLAVSIPDWIMLPDSELTTEIMRRAGERYQQISTVLAEEAQADPDLRNMATTMTLAWSMGADLYVAHLGDSRAYLFHDGALRQLTRDHTLAQAMADRGEIAPEQVARNRLRHVLMQSLGANQCNVEPDIDRYELASGDYLLLCSDGLTDMVRDDIIASVFALKESAEAACRRLVDLALEAGGRDNVTVVVARYHLPDTP
ncbi:MAG: serine/threonine-protein phosphatase [Planctomycetes bacterium]|nr:serine/threonine-protein phosphatase [Planctomycetota bacterium]